MVAFEIQRSNTVDVYVNGRSKMSLVLHAPDATKELFLEKDCVKKIEFGPQLRVYKERWFALFLLVVVCVTSVMHIMHYTIIADIATKYYRISYTEVNWSFTVYLLAYVIFGFPATCILKKWGLRATVLLGMGATAIGSWIKVGAISPESYWIALLGQTVIATAQVLIMPIPPELAAVWFPSHQVSSACSIGVLGIEMGLATGFIVPPLFFQSSSSGDDIDDNVGKVLYQIAMTLSIVDTAVFILLVIFFKGRPKLPPSIAQLKIESSAPFLESAKVFMYNRSNVFLIIAYGIVAGLALSVSTLLNPLILSYYPDAHEDVGWIGLVMVLGGMLGTVICGVTLDIYGKFRQTILTLSGVGITAMICFTFAITRGIEFVYLISAIFGFSTFGMHVAGLELGSELGYPVPQGIIAGILTTSTQMSGIALTYLYSYLFEGHGGYYANLTMVVLFVIEFILMCSIRFNLRRRTVDMAHKL